MSNYRLCGSSQKGRSHETSGIVCQDTYYYIEKPDFIVAAVADGLGSSKHSDIASNIAAKSTVEYCANKINIKMWDNNILAIIKTAYDEANFNIKQTANGNLDDYDTTLTLAVLIQGNLYYGHAGDSGIIALRKDGIFEEVTTPQLGEGYGKERPVYPLAAESKWVFGKYAHRTHVIFLMTDGILNKVIPPLLENQKHKLDNAYLYYLYDNMIKNPDIHQWINGELNNILPQEVNYDDLTIVIAMCNNVKLRLQRKEYYEFPSETLWNSLLQNHKNRLYAYKESKSQIPEDYQSINKNQDYSNQQYVYKKISDGKRRQIKLIATLATAILIIAFLLIVTLLLIYYKENDVPSDNQPVESVPPCITPILSPSPEPPDLPLIPHVPEKRNDLRTEFNMN